MRKEGGKGIKMAKNWEEQLTQNPREVDRREGPRPRAAERMLCASVHFLLGCIAFVNSVMVDHVQDDTKALHEWDYCYQYIHLSALINIRQVN